MWRWYTDLTQGIPYAEIDAYCRLTGITMTPWDVALLQRLNLTARNAHSASRAAVARMNEAEGLVDRKPKTQRALSKPSTKPRKK